MVRVSYTFAPAFAGLEPALLVGVFTLLFMVWVGASRLDLTIVKGREWEARQVCSMLCAVLAELQLGRARSARQNIAYLFPRQYSSTGRLVAC